MDIYSKTGRKPRDFNNINSGITHLCGAVIAIPCAVALIVMAATRGSALSIVCFAVFGAAMFALYGASSLYHFTLAAKRPTNVLRRVDHMMIFILIAGTYTPVCLMGLKGVWGWTLFGVIWGMAALGMLFKVFWMNAPRILYTGLYVIMGWAAVICFYPLSKALSITLMALMLGGGVFYTAGAVFYAIKKPRLRGFGFHEIFHLFVLAGTGMHLAFMFVLITG